MNTNDRDLIQPQNRSLAVLVSGGGTTLLNINQKIAEGELAANVALVVASNPAAQQKLKARGIESRLIARRDFADTASFSSAIFDAVREQGCELVCLAGFLSLLAIPDDYEHRVLNIHPALLPAFGGKGMYGQHVHEAVLEQGCKVSGCTVHFADQSYDRGPIVLQRCCHVKEDDTPDTLAARVFDEECVAYPQAIQLVLDGKVAIRQGRSHIVR